MRAVVTGAGGFIGGHLCHYLKDQGYWIRGIDIKNPEFENTYADEYILYDLRYPAAGYFKDIDEVYHLAADMGGIGYIETHKAEIVFNNTMIDMLTLKVAQEEGVKKFLYTSSACVYPGYLQNKDKKIFLKEENAYPADAEDGYGWQKLMTKRTCRHFMEDLGLQTYVVRFHNIYGPLGTYQGGREKSPAALCRKVAMAKDGEAIEIWGNGRQIRSYCYIDDCVRGIYKLMQSYHHEPINIGSDRAISIENLADMIIKISSKKLTKIHHLGQAIGVKSRNADITKAKNLLDWTPQITLERGLEETYKWIQGQISQS